MKHLTTIATACFLTVALVMTSGCSQSEPPESDAETVEITDPAEDTEHFSVNQIVIAEAKAENPELAPFVNDDGSFDTRALARVFYETGNYTAEEAYNRAQEMAREWYRAYERKSQEVTSRV